MPTYQYACTACGHRFEAVQAFSDASLTDCPECAGRLRKVFSSVGIVFKGSGFYRTDSRSAPGKDGAKEPSSTGESKSDSSPGAAKSDAAKTESKSASSGTGTSGSSTSSSPAAAAS